MLSGEVFLNQRFPRASAAFQPLRLDIVWRRLLLVSFGASTRVGRLLLAGSSRMSQLPPLSSLLHLTDLLGEKGFKCWNEPGEDFKVPEANLRKEEMEKMVKWLDRVWKPEGAKLTNNFSHFLFSFTPKYSVFSPIQCVSDDLYLSVMTTFKNFSVWEPFPHIWLCCVMM